MKKEHAAHATKPLHDPKAHDSRPHEKEIGITASGVSPTEFHAKVHEPVKWVNHDSAVHIVNYNVSTVIGYTPPPSSQDILPDAEYTYTFIVPGEYAYHLDNDMEKKGRVIVTV